MSSPGVFSFTEFKEIFYQRFPDAGIFDCGKINLLKVVLEAFKVNYAARGKAGHRLDGSMMMYGLANMVRRMRQRDASKMEALDKKLKSFSKKSFLLVDHYSSRTVTNAEGNRVSYYHHRIAASLGRDETILLHEQSPPSGSDFDIVLGHAHDALRSQPLDNEERKFRRELMQFFRRMKTHFTAEEQLNIGVALEKFFGDYRCWRFILKRLPQKKIVLLCHYHHEGAIHAMREAGRKVFELQHGLIAPQDIFYCMPEIVAAVRERALFPDKIFVFGEHWKKQLQRGFEFRPDQIEVLGYYPYESAAAESASFASLREWINGRKVFLVTTQTYLDHVFVTFVRSLVNKIREANASIVVVVKNHPSEKHELYAELDDLKEVKRVNEPLPLLMPLAQKHFSVYSTTLYDALRFGVPGFAIDIEPVWRPYVDTIVQDGVAQRIDLTTPLSVLENEGAGKERERFYAEAAFEVLRNALTAG